MEDTKYNNGKIYIIKSDQTEKIYIGSTIQPLTKRLLAHKNNFKRWNNDKYGYVTSFEIIKFGDSYIELIELYPCNSKSELEKREGKIIKQNNYTVNKLIAGRTDKEFYEDNKDELNLKSKKNYQDNKDDRQLQHKEYYEVNKIKVFLRRKKYYEDNEDMIILRRKEYNEKNKEKRKLNDKKRYEKNKIKKESIRQLNIINDMRNCMNKRKLEYNRQLNIIINMKI